MQKFLVLCKKQKFFTKAPPPQHQCYYIVSSLQKITRFNSMVKDLRNKFSLDMNIGLLGLKFSVIITLKGGGGQRKFFVSCIKQDFFLSNENFLLDSDSLIVEDSMKKQEITIKIGGGGLTKFFRFLHTAIFFCI